MGLARVRFAETPNDVLRVVEIDAPLSAGGPDATWRTLFELRTQIVSAQLRVVGDRLLQTLHLAELDGTGIDESRGRQIKSRLEHTFGEQLPDVVKCASRAAT
jgi:UTP:GlnB (protein PII) uridylyltransferase